MTAKLIYKHVNFIEREAGDGPVDVNKEIRFVASTEAVDRYGDIIRAEGWQLDNYNQNPIALFGHDHNAPIGTTRVWLEGKRLMSGLKLAAAGTSALVDSVRSLVGQKILRAVSVGFLPSEEPKYLRDEQNDRVTGLEFTKQELLEISVVAVPANPEAVAAVRALKVDEELRSLLMRPEPGQRALSTLRARVALERLRTAKY
jgi:HK97 family phage prohead protease